MAAESKDKESIRIRLDPQVKPEWERVLKDRKITQQAAIASLVAWVVKQDPLLQVMLFGQTPSADAHEIARIVVDRIAKSSKPTKGK